MDINQNDKEYKKQLHETEVCGLVMPISGFQDYTAAHWNEVRSILERAIISAGYTPRPVWESSDSDIIHARIVRNLYNDKIVVVDVSGLNPNVMFELGMRLTFRRPTVIVADDRTNLPFDTSNIEHIIYPANLNFSKVENFMLSVAERVKVFTQSSMEGTYKPYLDTFGAFTVVEPEETSISFESFVVERLDELSNQISSIRRDQLEERSIVRHDVNYRNLNALRGVVDENIFTNEPVLRTIWSDENIDLLKKMWESGASASDIAHALGPSFTRNSVIGKAHRLGLGARGRSET
jgi:hypothetical protein